MPTAKADLFYNGKTQVALASNSFYTVTGGSATNPGFYIATVSLKDKANYVWTDGKNTDKSIAYSISKNQVAIPKAVIGLVYNGKKLTGVKTGSHYTVTGNTATAAGSYKATVTPAKGFSWVGGSSAAKKISWTIAKASQTVSAKNASKSFQAKNGKLASKQTINVKTLCKVSAKTTVTYAKSGSWNSNISISKTGTITVKKGLKKGTYKCKVKATATGTN